MANVKNILQREEVYFDQFGEFVKRFKIQNVPTKILEQEGKLVKISEIKVQ